MRQVGPPEDYDQHEWGVEPTIVEILAAINGTFTALEQRIDSGAQDAFSLGQGQFLQYEGLAGVAHETWVTFPDAPRETHTLGVLLNCGGGNHLISLLHKAMSPARAAWNRDFTAPLLESEWTRVNALTQTVSYNARFKLVHYNFLHKTYVTPSGLRRTSVARSDACPRCGGGTADFMHLAWHYRSIRDFWAQVTTEIQRVVGLKFDQTPQNCLLGNIPGPKRRKMEYTFLHLSLVLAKRRVAITWMDRKGLDYNSWRADTMERAVAEEMHMKQNSHGDKATDDMLSGKRSVQYSRIRTRP
ncbi:hypothetical protein NDU88_008924 [Pleurodeles waltl]|uniref:Uncharacterized protein n=1 Tax=Pleurodeles waltl TaxID=8319 RepID=A0AAV7QW70_PLEWA|nr:hypothetical protein NDU88_008924 [Pleurodeles waltl]